MKRDALLLYYSQLYVGKCSESTNLLQTLLEQILYPHAKNLIVWIHRFCLRKFTKCTKPLECWPCVCVCVCVCVCLWPLKYTQLQPMTFLSVAPSLCLSLKHTYYFSGLWVTAALFQFSVHFLLWRTPAVRVHQNWRSTHLCASCSLSFLIYSYYSVKFCQLWA